MADISRKTCLSAADCPAGMVCVDGQCVPAGDGGGGGVAGGGKCEGLSYPVSLPGSLDKCRQTWDPCCPGEYESTLMGKRLCCKRAGGAACVKDEDCPMGQKCVEGKCKAEDHPELDCPESYIPPQVKDTQGKPVLVKPCNAGWKPKIINDKIYCCKDTSVLCAKDGDCPEGQTCVDGRCQKKGTPDAECPEGKGTDYTGCPCGKKYTSMTGKCAAGYAFIGRTGTGWEGWKEGAVGKCECIKWCNDIGYEDDCNTKKGGQGGEFKWSPELQGSLKGLMDRIRMLLENPRGTTPQERQAIINYMTEGIKRAERPRLQSSQDQMARMGLLGSGLELGESDRIKRGTEEQVTNAKRQVAIDELDRRFQELTGASGLAGSLLGTSMTAEQIPEVLSASRRGEGRQDMSMMLNYLQTLMGGQNSAFAPYLQAILTQMQQSGGSSNSWLPWLMYLMMPGQGAGTNVRRA